MTLAGFRRRLPVLATALVTAALYAAASYRYPGFATKEVFINLLRDNSVLGLAALGVTFVIISGGIDLSVGAVIGWISIQTAVLIAHAGWHPLSAFAVALAGGLLFGAAQGAIVHFFRLPPFLVTLAGMFLARGLAQLISLESVGISHALYNAVDTFSYERFPVTALVYLGAALVLVYVAHATRPGRYVYALGGSEPAALLMGLPVWQTKVGVYALSGLLAALAGVVHTLYTQSGNATTGVGLELDAIAAAVIGGTLLSGGVGSVGGTVLGVLLYGIIQTALAFDGTLSSWWTRIAVGALLLVFVLLQRLLQGRTAQQDD
jgi:simple sugar transport system permease protein